MSPLLGVVRVALPLGDDVMMLLGWLLFTRLSLRPCNSMACRSCWCDGGDCKADDPRAVLTADVGPRWERFEVSG